MALQAISILLLCIAPIYIKCDTLHGIITDGSSGGVQLITPNILPYVAPLNYEFPHRVGSKVGFDGQTRVK
jgi:hypothetical protein